MSFLLALSPSSLRQFAGRIHAYPAIAIAARRHVEIVSTQRMAVLAMRLLGLPVGASQPHVLEMCPGFEMIRVDACVSFARVMDLVTHWQRSFENLIREYVRAYTAAEHIDRSVSAAGLGACPDPAAGVGDHSFAAESLFRSLVADRSIVVPAQESSSFAFYPTARGVVLARDGSRLAASTFAELRRRLCHGCLPCRGGRRGRGVSAPWPRLYLLVQA